MAKESKTHKLGRALEIIKLLKKYYPDAHCALHHENADQLLVATILSAQCTDERVNLVTKDLFKSYPDIKAFAKASPEDLEFQIRSINFYKNKAKNIKAAAQKIVKEHKAQVPQDLEALCELPGVGRKTANVVLGNAFSIATGIVVDTHVKRLAYRLGLTSSESPEVVEQDLMPLVPKKDWVDISHWLIFHGRQICKARTPQCEVCFLYDLCPKKGVVLKKTAH